MANGANDLIDLRIHRVRDHDKVTSFQIYSKFYSNETKHYFSLRRRLRNRRISKIDKETVLTDPNKYGPGIFTEKITAENTRQCIKKNSSESIKT